jgi:hypothetical protein
MFSETLEQPKLSRKKNESKKFQDKLISKIKPEDEKPDGYKNLGGVNWMDLAFKESDPEKIILYCT